MVRMVNGDHVRQAAEKRRNIMGVSLRLSTSDNSRPGLQLLPRLTSSLFIYLGLVTLMFLLRSLQEILPLQINPGQGTTWLFVAITALLGWIGVLLVPRTGFPEMWDAAVTNWQRLWLPLLIGLTMGAAMVIFDFIQVLARFREHRIDDQNFADLVLRESEKR
jgi:hypothetical protein